MSKIYVRKGRCYTKNIKSLTKNKKKKKSFKLSLFQREKRRKIIYGGFFIYFFICVERCELYINIFKKHRFRCALFIAVTTTAIHQQSSIEKKFNWIKPISTFYVFFISIDDNGMTLTTSWASIIIAASELRGVFSAIKKDQSKALHSVLFSTLLSFFSFWTIFIFRFSSVLPSSHFPSIWMRITTTSSSPLCLCPGSPRFFFFCVIPQRNAT